MYPLGLVGLETIRTPPLEQANADTVSGGRVVVARFVSYTAFNETPRRVGRKDFESLRTQTKPCQIS